MLKFTASLPCSSKKTLLSFNVCQAIKGVIILPKGNIKPANAEICIKKALVFSLFCFMILNYIILSYANIYL